MRTYLRVFSGRACLILGHNPLMADEGRESAVAFLPLLSRGTCLLPEEGWPAAMQRNLEFCRMAKHRRRSRPDGGQARGSRDPDQDAAVALNVVASPPTRAGHPATRPRQRAPGQPVPKLALAQNAGRVVEGDNAVDVVTTRERKV
jgi:hypothetical protein